MDAKVRAYLERYPVGARTRAFLDAPKRMFIDGAFVEAADGASVPVIEPCTGGVLCEVPSAAHADVDRAVAGARRAFAEGDWSRLKPAARERLLHRLAGLVEERIDTVAEIESLDAGKAISGCRAVDMAGSIDLLHYMAGWCTKIEGATRDVSLPGEHLFYTRKQPIGVVAAIVPWNWPFNMAIWKLAAPLAAGCTVVLKPAQQTPLSMLYFAELCVEAGLPAGALSIVTGRGNTIGDHLVGHRGINKVSFTGSTEVGIGVGRAAMQRLSRVTLELGGKSPMLVFDDADIERVVAATQQSVYFNSGQVCSAGSRLYAQRGIHDAVVEAVAARARAMRIGATLDPETEMGPAISAQHRAGVLRHIEQATSEGADLVCGGAAVPGEGFFLQPTLFAQCSNRMRIVQEEVFGPVLAVVPFDDEAEALRLANDNAYGLAASVFTQDISRAHRLAAALEAGTVWVNSHDLLDCCTPFGGVKDSGIGKDLGPEQLAHFLETKSVWVAL